MLEARSSYGYFESEGGFTGETPPTGRSYIERRMYYWDYKDRYPECKTLGDYDKRTKTITVLIPEQYAERPNFGNTYRIRDFFFTYSPVTPGLSDVYQCKAKCYSNALRHAQKWARSTGKAITGNAPGYEHQEHQAQY